MEFYLRQKNNKLNLIKQKRVIGNSIIRIIKLKVGRAFIQIKTFIYLFF